MLTSFKLNSTRTSPLEGRGIPRQIYATNASKGALLFFLDTSNKL